MNTSIAYIAGLAVGILVAAVVLSIVRKRLYGKAFGSANETFDERQQLARGKAYKAAFFTAMGHLVLSALIGDALDAGADMALGICLSVAVFAVICVKNDAYLSLREKPKTCIKWFLFLALFNLVPLAMNLAHGEALIENGVVTHRAVNGFVALLLIVVSAAIALRQRELRKELTADGEAGEDA